MPRIEFEDVKKTFAVPPGESVAAIEQLSFVIADQELLTVVGPSGSGKTTLLRLIAGLETPDCGRISFDAQPVTYQTAQERNVAMVFQSHALFPHLTAFDNIGLGLRLRKVATEQQRRRVHEVAELLGIVHCLGRVPAKLSGGEKQRVALGRALVREPRILLLDEPFAQLDEPLRLQLQTELPALRARFATTMVFVTHDQSEALALGDRVLILRRGSLQQIGPPQEVYAQPANQFVASFIGSPQMNLIHGTAVQRAGHLWFVGAETEPEPKEEFCIPLGSWRADWFGANVGRPILLGLRPQQIRVSREPATAPVTLTGRLLNVRATE